MVFSTLSNGNVMYVIRIIFGLNGTGRKYPVKGFVFSTEIEEKKNVTVLIKNKTESSNSV
jgi:hypothetical protein